MVRLIRKKTVYLLRTSVSLSLQANSYQLFFLALFRTLTMLIYVQLHFECTSRMIPDGPKLPFLT